MLIAKSASEKNLKSVNIWQSYKQERDCLMHFARLVNTLLNAKKVHETMTFLVDATVYPYLAEQSLSKFLDESQTFARELRQRDGGAPVGGRAAAVVVVVVVGGGGGPGRRRPRQRRVDPAVVHRPAVARGRAAAILLRPLERRHSRQRVARRRHEAIGHSVRRRVGVRQVI